MRIIIFIIVCLSVTFLSAQGNFLSARKVPVKLTPYYLVKTDTPYVFVPSGFAENHVAGTKTPDSLKNHVVYEIVLAYSQYKFSKDFDQEKLNEERWNKLKRTHPELFKNPATSFFNVCQTAAVTDSAARILKHGFFIYYRKPADEAEREKEIDDLHNYLVHLGIDLTDTTDPLVSYESVPLTEETTVTDSVITPGKTEIVSKEKKKKKKIYTRPRRTIDSKVCRRPFYGEGNDDIENFLNEYVHVPRRLTKKSKGIVSEITLRLHFNGRIMAARVVSGNRKMNEPVVRALAHMDAWNPAIRNGVTVRSEVKIPVVYVKGKFKLTGEPVVQKMFTKCDCCTPDSLLFPPDEGAAGEIAAIPFIYPSYGSEDSIIRKVVERNAELKDMLVVVDLTGSMSPYILQVITLMEELTLAKQVKCFSLFNDGDWKADHKKEVGKTGGVYIMHGEITLQQLGKTILKAMRRGGGGDIPENNIEAAIKGIEACPECREVVMLADNYATPRDSKLIGQIKSPMHWIICGGENHLNTDYLDLVRENRGILHTLNYDVKDLHLVAEGQAIKIGEQEFVLVNGKFRVN